MAESAKTQNIKKCKLVEVPPDRKTKEKLAAYYELSVTSINNYNNFASGILEISEKNFELAKVILEEKIIIALHDVNDLASRSKHELANLLRLINQKKKQTKYIEILSELGWRKSEKKNPFKRDANKEPEIRKIPKYDPDVELAGLIFTLPSWLDSMNRIYEVDLKKVSCKTKKDLYENIRLLNETTENLMQELENN